MNIITYKANVKESIYRVHALGSYDQEDLESCVSLVLENPTKTVGIILDLREGLPAYPKEQASVYGRLAKDSGVTCYCLAIIVNEHEAFDLKRRYTSVARYFSEYIQTDIKFFTQENKASLWLLNHEAFKDNSVN